MNVLVSGSHGLIGSSLVPHLTKSGHEVVQLVRGSPGPGEAVWDPMAESLDPQVFAGVEAVVHLAGENIAGGRWTPAVKGRIRDSRRRGTRLLSETIAALSDPPQVVVSASAVGIYGDRGEERVTEASPPGHDFLAEVCQEWENAWEAAEKRGIRVVKLRFGIVLSPKGGALAKMLLPFQWGLGGKLGSGRQYMNWISLDDAVGAILHALHTPSLAGPVNVVAPEPVTNATFTRILGRVLHRPTRTPTPAFALRLALGEMADALLLSSNRAYPEKLASTGFRFQHGELEEALRHVLGLTVSSRLAPD